MMYVRFSGDTPFVGTQYEEYHCFADDTNEEFLQEFSDELCYNNAEDYTYLVYNDIDNSMDLENEEDELDVDYKTELDEFFAECCGYYEIISLEEYLEETEQTFDDCFNSNNFSTDEDENEDENEDEEE